ncbi:MAG TPA: GntR family transcriptional regulator [Acidobacteriaceae bacterium]|jgi:GntR family transcriptional regulator
MNTRSSKPVDAFRFELNAHSGVPVYRQLMDQVQGAIAAGRLKPGDQLPTIRQVAVDLAINPNTVTRAYREMEIRSLLETQQGSGTFIAEQQTPKDNQHHQRQLRQLATETIARAGANGFTLTELVEALHDVGNQQKATRR